MGMLVYCVKELIGNNKNCNTLYIYNIKAYNVFKNALIFYTIPRVPK